MNKENQIEEMARAGCNSQLGRYCRVCMPREFECLSYCIARSLVNKEHLKVELNEEEREFFEKIRSARNEWSHPVITKLENMLKLIEELEKEYTEEGK